MTYHKGYCSLNINCDATETEVRYSVAKSKCNCWLLVICFSLSFLSPFFYMPIALTRNKKRNILVRQWRCNYNDNDSDKNNYNVEIIRNCRSTIAICNLLLLSLHGGWLKYIYFFCTRLLPSHQHLRQTINFPFSLYTLSDTHSSEHNIILTAVSYRQIHWLYDRHVCYFTMILWFDNLDVSQFMIIIWREKIRILKLNYLNIYDIYWERFSWQLYNYNIKCNEYINCMIRNDL